MALLGSVWDVAVLPPIVYPSILAFLPEPSETTLSRIFRTVSEVSAETIPASAGYSIFYISSLRILHGHSEMRCYAVSAIDQGTDGRRKLDGRNLKGLSKSNGSKLHISHIFLLVHDRSCLSRKIYACFFHKSELLKIFIIIINPQTEPYLNKKQGYRNFVHPL